MHLFHRLSVGGEARATGEHMLIHVSLETRRASPPGPAVAKRMAEVWSAHQGLPAPEGAGRAVGQGR
jgi:carnitine 3-dehydrogenase